MKPEKESATASLAVIGVDIGKEVFHLVAFGVDGKDRPPEKDQATGSQRRIRDAAAMHCWHACGAIRPIVASGR